jgi:outer membrane protein
MNTSKLRWLLSALLVVGSIGANAQDFKVGVVNIQRITNESLPAKTAQSKLEQEANVRPAKKKEPNSAVTCSVAPVSTRKI